MSLVVIGTVAFDSVKTPFGSRERTLGGSATYFAVAASFFTPVSMVAVVGEDFPEELITSLGQRGIDTRGVVRTSGETFRWKGEYGHDLNEARTLETHLNVLERFNPQLPDSYQDARFLFLANIDPVLQLQVRRQVRRPVLVAADTMNFWIQGKRADLLRTLAEIDLLVINDAEARMLADEPSLVRAARSIRAMGPRSVIVKRGEYGVALFGEGDTFAAPAFPLEDVLDPTGAGDSFAGGMMGYLSATDDLSLPGLRKAMAYGTIIASYNIEAFSLERMKQISRGDVDKRFGSFRAMFEFGA
jgi:sugar/nucleoside kinase (ribokinase family)